MELRNPVHFSWKREMQLYHQKNSLLMPFCISRETKVIWCIQASAFVPGDPLIHGIWWVAWLIKFLGKPQKSPSTIYICWWFHLDCWGDLIEIWVIAWGLIWGLPIILFALDHFKSMLIQYADLSAKILHEIHVLSKKKKNRRTADFVLQDASGDPLFCFNLIKKLQNSVMFQWGGLVWYFSSLEVFQMCGNRT